MDRTVLPLCARSLGEPARAGHKVAGLHLLLRHGFPVPPGFCVFPIHNRAGCPSVTRGLAPAVQRMVTGAYRRLGGAVAVRSAAAGHPALLGLVGEEAVARGVARYLDLGESGTPVIVQRLLDGIASGVAYSITPKTGAADEILILGGWGLGCAPVPGEEEGCDRFRVGKHPLLLRAATTMSKNREARAGPMGLVRRPVTPSLRSVPCLTEEQILALGRFVRRIEEKAGHPVRLEWVLTAEGFYFLELAPAPAPERDPFYLPLEEGSGTGAPIFHDVAWEIPRGVISPVTCDLLGRAARNALAPILAGMGLGPAAAVPPLSLVQGRVGLDFVSIGLEIEEMLELPPGTLVRPAGDRRAGPFPRALGRIRFGLHLLPRVPWLLRYLGRFEANARLYAEELFAEGERLARLSAGGATLRELAEALDSSGSFLGRRFTAFFAAEFANHRFRRFMRSFGRWCGSGARLVGPRFCAGLGAPDEVEWGYALWDLARRIGSGGGCPETAEEIEGFVEEIAAGHEAAAALESVASSFGHCGAGWCDLENPRWAEDQNAIHRELLAFMKLPAKFGPEEHRRRWAVARSQAMAWVEGRLSSGRRRLFFWRRRSLEKARLRMAAASTLMAETHRGLARFFWGCRRLLLRAGEELVRTGHLARKEEIFLLRLDEISACLRDEVGPDRFQAVRAGRAEARARYRTASAESSIRPRPSGNQAPHILRGTAASPGRAAGRACVVRSPADFASFPPGAILVAPGADYGWAPLFLRAAAVATAAGREMSPQAVLGREYGLPVVVGIAEILETVADGDLLEVDGGAGTVTVRLP